VFTLATQVTWLKDGEPFAPESGDDDTANVRLVYENSTILVRRAEAAAHAAKYTCIATNKVGEARKDFVVQLRGRVC
jgi:hypothetical protein